MKVKCKNEEAINIPMSDAKLSERLRICRVIIFIFNKNISNYS